MWPLRLSDVLSITPVGLLAAGLQVVLGAAADTAIADLWVGFHVPLAGLLPGL